MPTKIKFIVVSLPGSSRRKQVQAQFAGTDFAWSFFDALTGLPDELSYDSETARRVRGRYLEGGELGCFGSHFMVWKQLLQEDDVDAYIVLEDDVVINKGFFQAFLADPPATSKGPHYLRFHAKVPVPMISRRPFMDRFLVEFGEIAYGTQAYYIDKQAATSYVASIKSVIRPIDDEMDRAWVHGVPNYCVFPHPVFELHLASTISSKRRQLQPPAGIKRLGWLSERLIEKCRKVRYRLSRRLLQRRQAV